MEGSLKRKDTTWIPLLEPPIKQQKNDDKNCVEFPEILKLAVTNKMNELKNKETDEIDTIRKNTEIIGSSFIHNVSITYGFLYSEYKKAVSCGLFNVAIKIDGNYKDEHSGLAEVNIWFKNNPDKKLAIDVFKNEKYIIGANIYYMILPTLCGFHDYYRCYIRTLVVICDVK